jgi:cytochrome c1
MTTAAAADHEGEHGLDAGSWPWSHSGLLDSYDHASIRRGYQVYKQVRWVFNPQKTTNSGPRSLERGGV